MRKTLLFALGTLLLSTNCAHIVMTPPQPSVENSQVLRAANMAPAQVGTFTLDAKMPPADDKSMSMRGANDVVSPIDGSFTQYLKATLAEELKAAGLLDPQSKIVITGSLVDTQLHASIGTATGSLKARFVVTREGAVRFNKELTVSDSWDSSFMGAIAIPQAANQYQGLYRKMVTALLNDTEFKAAVGK